MKKFQPLGGIVVGIAIGSGLWFLPWSWKHLIITVVFGIFIFFGFDGARLRASWARLVFIMAGGIGILYTITAFLVDSKLISLSRGDIELPLATARGFMLGLIIALAVSGQLLGRKHEPLA
jgi:hypothetical protein